MNALPVNYSTLPACCFVPAANLTSCCAATGIPPAACSYTAQCQTPNDTFPLLFTAKEKPLVRDMTNFWASFAANDDAQPSGGRKPWPVYMYRDDEATAAKSNTMQLDVELEVSSGADVVKLSCVEAAAHERGCRGKANLTPHGIVCYASLSAALLWMSL